MMNESPHTAADPKNNNHICIIFGGGGHACVLIDCIQASRLGISLAILDANASRWGLNLLGVPIVGDDSKIPELIARGADTFAVGLGSVGISDPRKRLFDMALKHSLQPLTVIHPSSIISVTAEISEGSQLLPGCIVNSGARIGRNVIVNSGAIVEHDCLIEDHVHIASGARLSGNVTVRMGAHVGAGATILQNLTIGRRAIVGAGAVVIRDVEPGSVVVGVPARNLRSLY